MLFITVIFSQTTERPDQRQSNQFNGFTTETSKIPSDRAFFSSSANRNGSGNKILATFPSLSQAKNDTNLTRLEQNSTIADQQNTTLNQQRIQSESGKDNLNINQVQMTPKQREVYEYRKLEYNTLAIYLVLPVINISVMLLAFLFLFS